MCCTRLHMQSLRDQELCESRGGRPGLRGPYSPYGLCGRRATLKRKLLPTQSFKAKELCESRGGRPGIDVPNSPYGFCGRRATLKRKLMPTQSPYT